MGLEPRAARAGRAGWRPLGLGSGSYRSAAGVRMQGGPASGTGQPAGRRHATRGSAGLPRCQHRRPCLRGPRSATRLPLPPPVSRVTPPQLAAPGPDAARPELPAPTAGHSPAAHPEAPGEGGDTESFLGKSCAPLLRPRARSSTETSSGDAQTAKVWSRPRRAPSSPRARSLPAAWPGRRFISEVTPRRPEGAARPIGHERGFLQLPRPPLPPPPEAPPAQPAHRPWTLPPAGAGLGWGPVLGLQGRQASAGPRSGEHPRPRPPGSRLSRGPRRTPAPARAAGTRARGRPAVDIRRPPAATVLVGTPKTKTQAAPRVRSPR